VPLRCRCGDSVVWNQPRAPRVLGALLFARNGRNRGLMQASRPEYRYVQKDRGVPSGGASSTTPRTREGRTRERRLFAGQASPLTPLTRARRAIAQHPVHAVCARPRRPHHTVQALGGGGCGPWKGAGSVPLLPPGLDPKRPHQCHQPASAAGLHTRRVSFRPWVTSYNSCKSWRGTRGPSLVR